MVKGNHRLVIIVSVSNAAAIVRGWDRRLRRAYQMFGLLFLLQWNLGMGPHSLLWQLARSFHLDPVHDVALLGLVRGAALGCGLAAGLRWRRDGRRLSAGLEFWLASAVLLIAFSHPLFAGLRACRKRIGAERAQLFSECGTCEVPV